MFLLFNHFLISKENKIKGKQLHISLEVETEIKPNTILVLVDHNISISLEENRKVI